MAVGSAVATRHPVNRFGLGVLVHLTTSGSMFKGYSTTNAARRATVKDRAEGPEGQYFSRLPCRVECV